MATSCEWEEGMEEISGFGEHGEDGARYEACCRAMLSAGVEWLEVHPALNPRFSKHAGIAGILREDNDEATAMLAAMVAATHDLGGATGAQIETCVGDALFIAREGWPAYVALKRAKKAKAKT